MALIRSEKSGDEVRMRRRTDIQPCKYLQIKAPNAGNDMRKKILVIGDAILDVYASGYVYKLLPDMPAPVFRESGEVTRRPGGAANTAVNLAAAGMETLFLSEVGDDAEGKLLEKLLRDEGVKPDGVIIRKSRKTTRKLRYISNDFRLLMRADSELCEASDEGREEKICERVRSLSDGCSLLIISDYREGFLSGSAVQRIIALAADSALPVFVDVRGFDPGRYRGATLLKPNRKGLASLTGLPADTPEEVSEAALRLCQLTGSRYVLATLDKDGMMLFDQKGLVSSCKSLAVNAEDTTGAGDTALAYFAASYAEGRSFEESLRAASRAAALQVMHRGTGCIRLEEVSCVDGSKPDKAHTENRDLRDSFAEKKETALIEALRAEGKRIVFTNGCFDILHAGHVKCLEAARQMGDYLIVGLNSDESVRRLKGKTRPFNGLSDRIAVLSALSCVDLVIPFEEDTPLRLIESLRPDVWVKGGDYSEADLDGSAFVRSYGGEIRIVPLLKGRSTTAAGSFLFGGKA